MKPLLIASLILFGFSLFAKSDESQKIRQFIKANEQVLIHVHASWCPSCKVQKKILESMGSNSFKILEVDFDTDKDFLKENKIFQQSMLLSFISGKEVKRVFGITEKDKIMAFINSSFHSSLQDELNKKRGSSKAPENVRLTMEQATQKLIDSGIVDKALKKGNRYIDAELPNIKGDKIKLSDRLKKGPVILTFYRGGWCPYCNIQLKAYQERLDDFKSAGGQLIAVSPESMNAVSTTTEKNEIEFEILTDKNNAFARKYGLVFKLDEELKQVYLKFGIDLEKNQGNNSWELPIPATYVINKKGEIVYSFLNVDYVQRAEPEDILSVLRKTQN